MSGRCNGHCGCVSGCHCGCVSGCHCGNGCNRNTNYAGDMKDLLASILLEMKKNTALQEKNTGLLESILGEMKQSNHNKQDEISSKNIQDENGPLGNGKKHQAGGGGSSSSNNEKSFVVVDLKATCWDKEENKDGQLKREIVEFSSVLVDAATGDSKSTFHKYVTPTENRLLSEYCKKTKGIKQEDVDSNDAMSLDKALDKHQAWIRKQTNGNCVVVTWSDWACGTMLKQECSRKNLDIPDYFHRWIVLVKPFAELYGKDNSIKVKEALEATGLKWEGPTKGGESNAHNRARLLSLLIHQGANLAITGRLDPAAAAPNNN